MLRDGFFNLKGFGKLLDSIKLIVSSNVLLSRLPIKGTVGMSFKGIGFLLNELAVD